MTADRFRRRRWDLLGGAVIAAAVAAIYWPLRHANFIWNDSDYVTAPALRSARGLGRIWFRLGATEQYYPLLHSAFWLEHRLWGDAAGAYHAVNVLLQIANAWLLAAVLRRLLRPAPASAAAAWLAAALFAVHPVAVESVAWISEQKNTLSTAFYLAALLAFLRFERRRSPGSYGIASALFLCALLSKTVTATLPGVAGVLIWWRRGRLEARRDLLPLLPWAALGAAAGLFSGYVERTYLGAAGSAFALSAPDRLLIAGRAVWFYLAKDVWPARLVFFYPRWELAPRDVGSWLAPVAVIGTLAGLWALRGRSRAPLALALIFVGTLFPVLGFLNVYAFIFSFVADHFQYVTLMAAAAGAALGGAALAARFGRAGRAGCAAAAIVVLASLAVAARRETSQYADAETFYRSILRRNPQAWLPWNNLGLLAYDRGRREEAIADYRRAVGLRPMFAEAQNNLGIALADEGHWAEAESHFRAALVAQNPFPQASANLARPLAAEGRLAEAESTLRLALRYLDNVAEVHLALGNVLLQRGDRMAALVEYERALRLRPDYTDARFNRGVTLEAMGRIHEAVTELLAARKLDPGRADIYGALGRILQRTGHPAEAAAYFREQARLAAPHG